MGQIIEEMQTVIYILHIFFHQVTVPSSSYTTQPGGPSISSSLASTANGSEMPCPSVASVNEGSSLTYTNMYNSPISVAGTDKVHSKTQSALLPKITESNLSGFPISTATNSSGSTPLLTTDSSGTPLLTTGSSGTPLLMTHPFHLNGERNEGTNVESPEQTSTPIMEKNNNHFMFMGDPEESNMRAGALSLFGSPNTCKCITALTVFLPLVQLGIFLHGSVTIVYPPFAEQGQVIPSLIQSNHTYDKEVNGLKQVFW